MFDISASQVFNFVPHSLFRVELRDVSTVQKPQKGNWLLHTTGNCFFSTRKTSLRTKSNFFPNDSLEIQQRKQLYDTI